MIALAFARACASLAALVPALAHAASCGVNVPGLDFGSYDVFGASALQSATTLSVACAKGPGDPSGSVQVAYTVALSTGSSGSYVGRTLVAGSGALRYNLYTGSSRSQVWGDGTGGSVAVSATIKLTSGQPQSSRQHTVYGEVPARQDVAVGAYADAILVTVTY
jgi:spore coat protein U-like protein